MPPTLKVVVSVCVCVCVCVRGHIQLLKKCIQKLQKKLVLPSRFYTVWLLSDLNFIIEKTCLNSFISEKRQKTSSKSGILLVINRLQISVTRVAVKVNCNILLFLLFFSSRQKKIFACLRAVIIIAVYCTAPEMLFKFCTKIWSDK